MRSGPKDGKLTTQFLPSGGGGSRGGGGHVTLTFLLETVGCTVPPKRTGNRPAWPASSSNPQPIPELPIEHVQEFKGGFTQCPWKGHAHRSNIMFQCDSHHRCCACTAAVLKCYGLVVQSQPGGGGGGVTTLGGGALQGGGMVPGQHTRHRSHLHPCLGLKPLTAQALKPHSCRISAGTSFLEAAGL